MIRLNLNEQFPPAANNDGAWKLEIKTRSRAELIQLSIFLAEALNPDFLHDMADPPIVMVPGRAAGKSMIVEAMMKTLLDKTDPLDMLKPGAPNRMFIEDYPMQALKKYCYAAGTQNGVPVLYGFDRISPRRKSSLVAQFTYAALDSWPLPRGGAIFGSRGIVGDKTGDWLAIHLKTGRYPFYSGWGRTATITVKSEKLKADPHFRNSWRRLHNVQQFGDLAKLAEWKPAIRPAAGSPAPVFSQVLQP